MSELFQIGLPKWPALIVKGVKVTKEQAMEIIIRTDGLDFISNDREFEREANEYLYGIYGCGYELYDALQEKYGKGREGWDHMREVQDEHKVIHELYYLRNARILSSWIGGPKGWCSWSGYIGCNNYNIGKYPSVEKVYEEWKIIAEAFPFLELKGQLLSGETDDEASKPMVEYSVSKGQVSLYKPDDFLDYPNDEMNFNSLLAPGSERGCTMEQLKGALDYVKNKYKQ